MEQARHDNEVSLLQSRREDFLKLTEARKAEEDRRRESMVGRGITAQQHKEVTEQMEQARHDEAIDELQYRRYLRDQKAESERDEARRSRESLAGRLNTWRAHRSIEGTIPVQSTRCSSIFLSYPPPQLPSTTILSHIFPFTLTHHYPHPLTPFPVPHTPPFHQNNSKTRSMRRNGTYLTPGESHSNSHSNAQSNSHTN
jgi:F0F1-type ATP synthase epsilon subunit